MPRLSASVDDEEIDSSAFSEAAMEVAEEAPVKKSKGRPKKKASTPTPPPDDEVDAAEEEEADEDGDDDDDEEDVYVVEAIINHRFDPELRYHVRWQGYPKLKDHTWEPEENLTAAAEVLNDYIESVGGREALAKVPRPGKKRGRKSTASTNGTPIAQDPDKRNGKRARKLESEDPQDTESPGPSKPRIPPGNWEDLIGSIDTMEKQVGGLYILLTFKDGNRIKQPASVVYKRCPQKMLQFYESHLSFRTTKDPSEPAFYEDYK